MCVRLYAFACLYASETLVYYLSIHFEMNIYLHYPRAHLNCQTFAASSLLALDWYADR